MNYLSLSTRHKSRYVSKFFKFLDFSGEREREREMMRGRSRLNESKKESKKKKEKVSWLKRISSSAVIQALMLATTKNRHFVAVRIFQNIHIHSNLQ